MEQLEAAAFIDALLGDVPSDKHALVWSLQNRGSSWVPLDKGTLPVAQRALSLAEKKMDVYIAVSVADEPGSASTRIESSNSAGIMGLWADIDIADPDVHKKFNLPPTEEAAFELLDACGVQPTCVVHSGHGLQAWWLFHEFWGFDTEQERLSASGLAQRWNSTLQVRAAERSWMVDSVFDLARVMRVPGTVNRKGTPPVPVRLLTTEGPRWNPSDFDDFVVDERQIRLLGISTARSYQPDKLALSETAQPPFEKFTVAIENSEQFEKTWKRQRRDFPDQSPSTYDLSLATQCAQMGFTDQEIADTVFAWRRLHKEDTQKALRQDYMQRTIGKARDTAARDRGIELLEEAVEQLAESERTGDPDEQREKRRATMDVVNTQLGTNFAHFIKYTSDPPTFAVVDANGLVIQLGPIGDVLNWFKFMSAILAATRQQIPRFKTPAWDSITAAIAASWVEQDVGLESTDTGLMQSWLGQYLEQRPPVPTVEEAVLTEWPYIDKQGRTVIFLLGFKRWLYIQHQEKVSQKELGKRLRVFGAESATVNVKVDEKRTSRSVWTLPPLPTHEAEVEVAAGPDPDDEPVVEVEVDSEAVSV